MAKPPSTAKSKRRVTKRRWTVYIIEAASGAYYTGITTDLERRFSEHLTGKSGAKFFRTAKPKEIVYQKKCKSHSEALRQEIRIKKLPRSEKMKLFCTIA